MTDRIVNNAYEELVVIREASQHLARRFSMIADVLQEATSLFRSVTEQNRMTNCSREVQTRITVLATDVSADGDSGACIEQLDSFEADAMFGRILELKNSIESHCGKAPG